MEENKDKSISEQNQLVITDALIKQVAALAAVGKSTLAISTELKISRYHVNKIMQKEEFRIHTAEVGDAAIEGAKAYVKGEMRHLAPEVVRVLKANLKKDKLEAVKTVLSIMGFNDEKPKDTGGGGISIVLASEVVQPKKDEDDYIEVQKQ